MINCSDCHREFEPDMDWHYEYPGTLPKCKICSKPTVTIDIGYYFQDFSEPDLDRDGIVCKSKWFKFRIDEMPRFEIGQDHLSIKRHEFTITGKAAWDYLPQVWNNDWFINEMKKWKVHMKEYLLNRVRKLVYNDLYIQMEEKQMKDEYNIEFNFVEIDPPK